MDVVPPKYYDKLYANRTRLWYATNVILAWLGSRGGVNIIVAVRSDKAGANLDMYSLFVNTGGICAIVRIDAVPLTAPVFGWHELVKRRY